MFIFQFLNDKIYNYVLFDITVNFVNQKSKKHTHFPHNLYKLSKAKFSRFDRTRGDKNQINICTLVYCDLEFQFQKMNLT